MKHLLSSLGCFSHCMRIFQNLFYFEVSDEKILNLKKGWMKMDQKIIL